MKKTAKVLSVSLMAIMVIMTCTACGSKKNSDNTGSKGESTTKEGTTTKEEAATKEESANNIENIKIGDIYTFGAYEQDNNTSNGKEAIEWIVVDKQGTSLCLVSKYALDCQQYNISSTDVTWETCSLRRWLNGTFINDAFSLEEQTLIETTMVTADKNPECDTDPGNDTWDKIFLLSITEAEKYFASDDVRMCAPTYYAIERGGAGTSVYVDGIETCWWWLRSPGNGSYSAAYVYNDGSAYYSGIYVDCDSATVRPALWINPESTTKEEPANNIENIKIGDIYTFGAYEQDNDTSNGKEAIEWIVVDKRGKSLFCLVSKYALDCQQYNTSKTDVTWETCSLREWLNNTFINDAFSSEEQGMIVTTTVTADKNPNFDTNPGNDTRDKIFLLSITEAEKYFPSDDVRMCAPTDYAIACGTLTSDNYSVDGRGTCCWWLRSPGDCDSSGADVRIDGAVHFVGDGVDYDSETVRPALWINLEY